MARDIYIVRHGNTFDTGDVVTRVGARTDLPLSKSGQTQAEQLAAHFAFTLPEGFAAATAGPLIRTQETAMTILAMQDAPPSLETADFLREIDYGPDENQPEPAVLARIGQDALKAWETSATPPPGWIVDPDALTEEWRNFFAREAARSADDDRPILAVTSNGVARFALAAAQAAGSHPLKLRTGAYGVVRVTEGGDAMIQGWDVRP